VVQNQIRKERVVVGRSRRVIWFVVSSRRTLHSARDNFSKACRWSEATTESVRAEVRSTRCSPWSTTSSLSVIRFSTVSVSSEY
jgi:hypothetical protein